MPAVDYELSREQLEAQVSEVFETRSWDANHSDVDLSSDIVKEVNAAVAATILKKELSKSK